MLIIDYLSNTDISLEERLNHVVELLVGLGNGVGAINVLDDGSKAGTTVHDSLFNDGSSGSIVVHGGNLVVDEVGIDVLLGDLEALVGPDRVLLVEDRSGGDGVGGGESIGLAGEGSPSIVSQRLIKTIKFNVRKQLN